MKKQLCLYIACIVSLLSAWGQFNSAHRKLILKSDVILVVNSSHTGSEIISDHETQYFDSIYSRNIDTILVNKTKFKKGDYRLKSLREGEDVFLSSIYDGGCLLGITDVDVDSSYVNILFLKKVEKEYHTLAELSYIEVSQARKYYFPEISELIRINNLKEPKEKYRQSVNWFIDNDIYPDYNFLEYYIRQGIISKDNYFDDEMKLKAKKEFLTGKENLLPIIQDTYTSDAKNYYLQKMKRIANKPELTYSDYYDFYSIIENMYDFRSDSSDYILRDIITEELDYYQKQPILNYFIKKVEIDDNITFKKE